jgi:hypothetical protein
VTWCSPGPKSQKGRRRYVDRYTTTHLGD